MPFPMNQKEFDNWTKTRKFGKFKYSLRTSFIATIVVFLSFFITNAYVHFEHIDKYIAYNLGQWQLLSITLLITFIILFICAVIIFNFTENRYKFTEQKNDASR